MEVLEQLGFCYMASADYSKALLELEAWMDMGSEKGVVCLLGQMFDVMHERNTDMVDVNLG